MGIFSSKPKPTDEQLKLIGRLDATYENLEKDLNSYEGFIKTFVEQATEIHKSAPKPIKTWDVLDEVCKKNKMELMLMFSLSYSCDYLMSNTGRLRMRGFMKEAQGLAVRLDELKTALELNMAKILDPMVPSDQNNSGGMLGLYYCYEVIQSDFDFSESMQKKYKELDNLMKLHFGFKT